MRGQIDLHRSRVERTAEEVALRESAIERLEAAHLPIPTTPDQPGPDGRTLHTEEFAWLHGEFTMVSGSETDATW